MPVQSSPAQQHGSASTNAFLQSAAAQSQIASMPGLGGVLGVSGTVTSFSTDSDSSNSWWKVAAVIAAIVAVLIIVIGVLVACCYCKKDKGAHDQTGAV